MEVTGSIVLLVIIFAPFIIYLIWHSYRTAQIRKHGTACDAEINRITSMGRFTQTHVTFTYNGIKKDLPIIGGVTRGY